MEGRAEMKSHWTMLQGRYLYIPRLPLSLPFRQLRTWTSCLVQDQLELLHGLARSES
jgi:hypothetical protein